MMFAGDLKKQCETVLGVVSQCCLTKHVFKMSKQYLANVALKINVKVKFASQYWVNVLVDLCEAVCTTGYEWENIKLRISDYLSHVPYSRNRSEVGTLFWWMHLLGRFLLSVISLQLYLVLMLPTLTLERIRALPSPQ